MADPVSVNYILAGGNRHFNISNKLKLHSGAKTGAGIIASKDDYFDTITKVATQLGAGVK